MEYWDLYDEHRNLLNKKHIRGMPMQKGEYHIIVSIWTVNSKGEILVTLRHPDKEAYPNFWESSGGSVLAGETSRQGAVRELFEETGIQAEEKELVLLSEIREETAFNDVYMLKKDISIDKLVMQEGETAAAKWVTPEQFLKMAEDKLLAKPVIDRFLPLWNDFILFLYDI